jgi:hypothetical protein
LFFPFLSWLGTWLPQGEPLHVDQIANLPIYSGFPRGSQANNLDNKKSAIILHKGRQRWIRACGRGATYIYRSMPQLILSRRIHAVSFCPVTVAAVDASRVSSRVDFSFARPCVAPTRSSLLRRKRYLSQSSLFVERSISGMWGFVNNHTVILIFGY